VFVPLGQVADRSGRRGVRREGVQMPHRALGQDGGESTEIATFFIGEEWFGIPSSQVVEAIDVAGITPIPGMPGYVRGVLMFERNPILVFDLKDHLHFGAPVDADSYRQIVVVRGTSGEAFGILVHRLGEIPEVANHCIDAVANLFPGDAVLAESLVKPDPASGRSQILVVLSAERIYLKLVTARRKLAEVTTLPAQDPGVAVAALAVG
jgi:chemotaxis signal transduction protein